jgi:hypothetical protein
MSTGLLHFVYNTLCPRLNNPQNHLFLPKQLNDLQNPNGGGKLLPMTGTDWNIGAITGQEGHSLAVIIANAWWTQFTRNPDAKNRTGIPCPDNQWPQFAFPEVTVNGLSNVRILPDLTVVPTQGGYQITVTLHFGDYQGEVGGIAMEAVQLTGKYSLKQSVCSAPEDQPNACDHWKSDDLEGDGQFTATFKDVFMDATLTLQVAGQGGQRSLQVTVDSLKLHGQQESEFPTYTIDNLTVDNTSAIFSANHVWIPAAKKALQAPDGEKAIMQNLTDMLNQEQNRQSIAKSLTEQAATLLDNALGKLSNLPDVAQTEVTNAFDQYLYDRLRGALNDSNSNFYLPKAVFRFSNPQLEPYSIQNMDLGPQSMGGLDFTSVTLTSGVVHGFSNLQLAPEQLLFDGADAHLNKLEVSALNPPPQVTVNGSNQQVPSPPLKAEGQFALTADGVDGPLTGGYTITIQHSNLQAVLHFAGQSVEDLQITCTQLGFQASTGDVQIHISIDSDFEDLINAIFNQDSIKSKLIAGLNDQAQKSLSDISQFMTDDVKKYLTSQLDS